MILCFAATDRIKLLSISHIITMSYRSYSAAAALKTVHFLMALPVRNAEDAMKKRRIPAGAGTCRSSVLYD